MRGEARRESGEHSPPADGSARSRRSSRLPQQLVAAAAALIAKKGPQGFSLREVARRAHVSQAAPYWHFADREALLAAVAEQGFLELAAELTQVWTEEADPRGRLQALGAAYVRFALRQPSYLRVMFGPEVPVKTDHPALHRASRKTLILLTAAIADAQLGGVVRAGDPDELAIATWSIVHGLAALLVDGQLQGKGATPDQVETLVATVTGTLLSGLAPR
jgi:AcrR family transcriptional regulator